jgi:hypothetical protein
MPPPPPIPPNRLPLARAPAPPLAVEAAIAAPSLGRCEAAAPAGPDDEIQFDCGQKMEESSITLVVLFLNREHIVKKET